MSESLQSQFHDYNFNELLTTEAIFVTIETKADYEKERENSKLKINTKVLSISHISKVLLTLSIAHNLFHTYEITFEMNLHRTTLNIPVSFYNRDNKIRFSR